MTLVSSNISLYGIRIGLFAGFPGEGRQKTVVNRKRRFSVLSDAESLEP